MCCLNSCWEGWVEKGRYSDWGGDGECSVNVERGLGAGRWQGLDCIYTGSLESAFHEGEEQSSV